jgi:hypothetical protein
MFHAECKPQQESSKVTQPKGQDSMKRRDFLKVTGIGAAGAATLAVPAIARVAELGYDSFIARNAQG